MRVEWKSKPAYQPITPHRYAGRFGGGWQYVLGIKVSRGARTIVLELLFRSIRIDRGVK